MEKRKKKGRYKKWMISFIFIICAAGVLFLFDWKRPWISVRREGKTAEDFQIPVYKSRTDQDGDGIDDQSDILEGALKYLSQKPKYQSKYYEGGYPDDGYGVCTDVVIFALKNAGYDLQTLVHEDIVHYPNTYYIDKIDDNIDFRRVRNLHIFFSHQAVSLTTDVKDIGQWQGGDIVVFKGHIGVVSDRRNERGVPYVLHHSRPDQVCYEEDILEKRDDLTAHYRIS